MRIETIGDCTLYLGDCLEALPGLGAVDFVFTDPPYGHNNNNNGDLIHRVELAIPSCRKRGDDGSGVYEARPIANDGAEANEIFRAVLPLLEAKLAHGGYCCCCCGGGGPDPQFARWSLWLDEVFDFKQMVVWDKGPMGMGWHYRRSYETVLVGQKRGGACKWYDESNAVENIIRPGYHGIKKIIPSADQHPTEKPVELAAHFIGLHSLPGETVLDPFAGRGSTGVAAIRMGRKFIGVEQDPEHFEAMCRKLAHEYAQGDFLRDKPAPKAEQIDLAI